MFRLKENFLDGADEMTCFCLCRRRCCSCIRGERGEVSGGWNCWRLESPNGATAASPPPTFRVNGKTTSLTPLGSMTRFGRSASCALISNAAKGATLSSQMVADNCKTAKWKKRTASNAYAVTMYPNRTGLLFFLLGAFWPIPVMSTTSAAPPHSFSP